MKILQLFGLGDTSTLLTVGLRRLGADCDLLLSNRAFVTQYPAWTKKYPELKHGCYTWDKSNTLDPRTVADLYKFIRKYDIIFAHPPAGIDAWNFNRKFCVWDGGSGNFIMSSEYDSKQRSDRIKRELARRSYKNANWIFFNDINVIHTIWKHVSYTHDRYCYMPLPVDIDVFKPMDAPLPDTFTVYMPTRQEVNIKNITGILQGFKLFLQDVPDAILAITRYGSDVPVIEHLISRLGIQANVQWVQLVPKPIFAKLLNRSHVIIDQIGLGAIGGVTVQALACNSPVIVNANQKWYKEALGEEVPIYNATNAQQVHLQLIAIYQQYQAGLSIKLPDGRPFITKHFEYNKVAKQVLDILQEII